MWDRCHWRFLYYIEENVPSLENEMKTTLGDKYDDVKVLFDAMNKDDHIYEFASKCGSWDWAGIGIMLLCCKCIFSLFNYSILWFLYFIMDYWWYHEIIQEES